MTTGRYSRMNGRMSNMDKELLENLTDAHEIQDGMCPLCGERLPETDSEDYEEQVTMCQISSYHNEYVEYAMHRECFWKLANL